MSTYTPKTMTRKQKYNKKHREKFIEKGKWYNQKTKERLQWIEYDQCRGFYEE